VVESDPTEACILETFADLSSAELARALLEAEGIAATVNPSDPIAAPLGGFSSGIRLYVHRADEDRARTVLRETDLSDGELASLATAGQAEVDAINQLACKWEQRFPDLSGEWTHWWLEAEGVLLSVVPGTELSMALSVVRENHQRFASIFAHRARVGPTGEPVRQKRRFEISNRRCDAQSLEYDR